VKPYAFAVLQKTDNFEKIICPRVTSRPKHPHQALRGNVGGLRNFRKTDSRVNVIAEDSLRRGGIARKHALDPFAQKLFAELGIARCTGTNGVFEIACQGHCSILLFSLFIILPVRSGSFNVLLLAFLGTAGEYNDDPLAVFAKIHPVSGTEIYAAFEHPGTDALDVRKIPQGKSWLL
jgi:hypothetical protein